MVDVVGLRFVAEGERDATNALKRYAAAQDKLKRSILDAASQVQRSASDWERANKLYDQGVLSAKALQAAHTQAARALAVLNGYVTKSGAVNTQRAAAEIRAAQATRESTKAAEEKARAEMQAAASYRQLKAAVDPAYAAQMRLSAAEETLNAAVLRGVISREEATRTLRQYQAQAEQTTRVVQGQAAATMFASRQQNASGMAMQQVGYQVGDFLVQVQSGTNAMVAFGQQATQLVGVLPMFGSFMGLSGTALIGLSAGLGIAIPLLTALGAFLMRAGDSADTLSEEVKALNTAFDEANTALDRLEDKDLAQTFGDYTAAVQGMSAAMLELNAAAAVTNLVSTFDAMESFAQTGVLENIKEGFFNIGRVINPFADGEGLFGIVTPEQLDREKFELLGYDMGREQFLDYVEGLKQAAAQGDIDQVTQLVRTFFADAADGTEAVSLQGLDLLRNIEASASAAAEFAARQNGSAQAAKDAAEAEKWRAEALMAGSDAYASHIAAYQEEQVAAAEYVAERQAALLEENTRFEEEQAKKRAIAQAEGDAARIAAINLYYDNAEKREAELARVEADRQRIRQSESDFIRAAEAETELARRKLEILQSYNAEGEATARTQELQIALDMDILRGKLLQQAAVDGITQAEREAIDEQVRMATEVARTQAGIENATSAAKGLTAELRAAASAMASLAGMGASVDVRIAGLEAEINAYAQGLNAQAERKRATELEKARQERDKALLDPGANVAGIDAVFQGVVQRLDREAALTTERDAIVEAQREADRAAKRGATAARNDARKDERYLYKLEQEAAAQRALIGLSEEQRIQDERRAEITLRLAEDGRALTETEQERINKIIAMEAQTRLLMEAEEKRQQLMQTVEGHIENAFMSFVDGSATVEEAFKGMLRNIILAIYQQQVAEPAARAVGGLLAKAIPALFSANGNVFSGGAHVTAYANGGVVNSPTMFQHSGGLGVMGEAGPEAIMPLKRGANGKLGVQMDGAAGGNVTVNQYFQVSANGDESVRRIVRQEAPRMAEMAKSAVVDAKRRGGTYGRSF